MQLGFKTDISGENLLLKVVFLFISPYRRKAVSKSNSNQNNREGYFQHDYRRIAYQ